MNLDVKSSSNGTSLPTSPARRDMPCGAAEHSDLLQKIYVRATVDSAWSTIIDGQCISSMWSNAHMQQEMLACDGMLTKLISLSRIQQHIEQETHVPVTLEMLLHAGARRTKHQKISWWSNVEAICRCVQEYHHAVGASEHETCRSIQNDICAYAQMAKRGVRVPHVDVTEFLGLLYQAITNRALNMALRKTIDQSLSDDLLVSLHGRRVTMFGRHALADILERCLDIVKDDYLRLRTDLRKFRR